MSQERDNTLVALAVEEGFITREQVEACRELQAKSPIDPPPSLLRLLVEAKHLTPSNVLALTSGRFLADITHCNLVRQLGIHPLTTTCLLNDPTDGQQYVIDIVHPSLAARPGFVDRLHRDTALATNMDHPNIVQTYGAKRQMGDLIVLTEYVEGATLEELIRARGKLAAGEVLSVALAGANALTHAMACRLTHGTVCPEAFVITTDGVVKLSRFGLPKAPVDEISIKKKGPGVRAPHYLSPEHFDRAVLPDHRSDLFSLGAVLYQALTGELPFDGDTTQEVIVAIRGGQFLLVKQVMPAASPGFAAIIDKLLQPKPDDRYPSPQELLDDLEGYQAGRMPEAQRQAMADARAARLDTSSGTAVPTARIRRSQTWIAVAVAAAILTLLAIYLLTRGTTEAPKKADDTVKAAAAVRADRRLKRARQALKYITNEAAEKNELQDADRLETASDAIAKLEAIATENKGTPVAEEARLKIIPFQADALFETAKIYAREHPDERKAIVRRYREVIDGYASTGAAFHAGRELEKHLDVGRKSVIDRFEDIKKQADALAAKNRFGAALAVYEQFVAKQLPTLLAAIGAEEAGASLRSAIGENILKERVALNSQADRAFSAIHEKARAQVDAQYYESAVALYTQVVETFGVEELVNRARAEVAVIQPLVRRAATQRHQAINVVKYEFFLSQLDPALACVRGWDFAGAIREAETHRPALKDAEIEPYLDGFLEDVALVRLLKLRTMRRLNDRANPVVAKAFSLGKVAGKFDPEWLKAQVLSADEARVVFRYGKVEVHRAWPQFLPDELYRLGKLSTDAKDPHAHLQLGIHALHAGLKKTAATEFQFAKAGGIDVAAYMQRVDLLRGATAAGAPETHAEEVSRLLREARAHMDERGWDRALFRLATLHTRHERGEIDLAANLPDVTRRIVACKKHMAQIQLETDLALGEAVDLLASEGLEDWQSNFGAWDVSKSILRCQATEDHDAECLRSLRHARSYVLAGDLRIVAGAGAILRLAGKARPNLGFWANAAEPDLVGLLYAGATDEAPAERSLHKFAFKTGQWYPWRATVSPASVKLTVGKSYTVRMANKLQPDPAGVQTYGFLVSPKSTAEFRNLTVRVLHEQ
ncbi:serine/threonine protein kinase [bacterium]|nr:serine/threonine protein kinase [bacterium]